MEEEETTTTADPLPAITTVEMTDEVTIVEVVIAEMTTDLGMIGSTDLGTTGITDPGTREERGGGASVLRRGRGGRGAPFRTGRGVRGEAFFPFCSLARWGEIFFCAPPLDAMRCDATERWEELVCARGEVQSTKEG